MLVFLKTAYFPACCAVLQVGFQVSQRSVRVCTYDIIYILYKARALVFHRSYFIEVTSRIQYIYLRSCLLFVVKGQRKKNLSVSQQMCCTLVRFLFNKKWPCHLVFIRRRRQRFVRCDDSYLWWCFRFFFYCLPVCYSCAFVWNIDFLTRNCSENGRGDSYLSFFEKKEEGVIFYVFLLYSWVAILRLDVATTVCVAFHRESSGQGLCECVFSSSSHRWCPNLNRCNGSASTQSIWSVDKRMEGNYSAVSSFAFPRHHTNGKRNRELTYLNIDKIEIVDRCIK